MLVAAELTERLLRKAVKDDPALATDPARMAELSRQAMRSPQSMVKDDEDRAFLMLEKAVSRAQRDIDDELDALYYQQQDGPRKPPSKLPQTHGLLERCLQADPHCYDAHTLDTLIMSDTFEQAISGLEELEEEARQWCEARSALYDDAVADPWDAVFLRPWLRMRSRKIDLLVQAACYRSALNEAEKMLQEAPSDGQGIRHTAALLYARLEDEEGLNDLDSRFGREGSCWMHVARTMLLYKLGRMDAAKRSLNSLARLCPGAAYFLATPSYVPPYLPDRPPFKPGSADESLYATYEADFLIVDTPEFVTWAMQQPNFAEAADKFGRTYGSQY
jgi:tetratricopeptide (TPR) repeat protein